MKCLNCGKEVEEGWSFQRCGRIMIGHDCDCGHTSYKNYIEATPPVVDCFDDICEALTKYAFCKIVFSDENTIKFVTENYAAVITEVISQIDFDICFTLLKEDYCTNGVFTREE